MARKSGDERSGQERRAAPRTNRRTIKKDKDTTQLLERGEGPTAEEQIDPGVDSPSEVVNENSSDAPTYGDWQRHSTGATSGARGKEGFGNPGENTWGEEQGRTERRGGAGPARDQQRPAEPAKIGRESAAGDPRDSDC